MGAKFIPVVSFVVMTVAYTGLKEAEICSPHKIEGGGYHFFFHQMFCHAHVSKLICFENRLNSLLLLARHKLHILNCCAGEPFYRKRSLIERRKLPKRRENWKIWEQRYNYSFTWSMKWIISSLKCRENLHIWGFQLWGRTSWNFGILQENFSTLI